VSNKTQRRASATWRVLGKMWNTKKSYNLSDTSGEIKTFSVFQKLRIASKNL
jgi:hypothetical protein